jgi:nitrate/TMAO reductase-like tetraheme cytochrome c subunit
MKSPAAALRSFLVATTRNVTSLLGVAITTASAVIIVTLFALELVGFHGSPYIGILAYLILPAIFLMGLTLVPVGILRARRRARRALELGEALPTFPVVDLNRDRTRRTVLIVLLLSLANVIILATATYKGVEIMDSTEFCGSTCHVMLPERTVYRRSPHARVKCVECHIGPGAGWFVKSKLSGAWQVAAVTFDLYPRPIPTPIENLRPARETCEQCHWPAKFVGDRLRVITHYASDEASTELKTVLLLRVGGVQGRTAHGIHWHVDPGMRIRYRSDEKRATIHEVEMTLPDGAVKLFRGPQQTAEGAAESWRTMDCVDCHNRPSHVYRMPEPEIDRAIALGAIDRSLPFVRREGLRLLQEPHASEAEARKAIHAGLDAFYRASYPQLSAEAAERIAQSARALGDIFATNVFPEMNVTWGTYPNHIGHQDFPGCFRCHDGEHVAADGEAISQDCSTCHTLLAMEEEEPEVLKLLRP